MDGGFEKLHIGCSGWDYKEWIGKFYQPGRSEEDLFSQYAGRFSTVEMNSTFYRLPEQEVFLSWKEQAPAGFVYSVKANRYITHMKKLKDAEAPLEKMFSRMRVLGEHLGPVLFQLPPNFKVNSDRLARFLELLPDTFRYVFEFRDSSWYEESVISLLRRPRMTICMHDMPRGALPRFEGGGFRYMRFHGPGGSYAGSYDESVIREKALFIREAIRAGEEVFVYFNNDQGCQAPADALRLINAVKGQD